MKFKCVKCGGTVRDSVTTDQYDWGGKPVVVFENVPCGVCDQCGERYFESAVERRMDALAQPLIKVDATFRVAGKRRLPVIDFAQSGVPV